MNSKLPTLLICTLILYVTTKKQLQQLSDPHLVRRTQLANRDELHINFQNSQNYYFQIRRSINIIPELQDRNNQSDVKQVDFVINGIEGQDIKMIANVFWKNDDTYVIPEVKKNQQVRLIVYENKTNILADRTFYIAQGVEISTRNLTQYYIRFEAQGIKSKVMQLTIEKLIPEVAINKTDFQSLEWVEVKSGKILASFNVMLRILQRNRIFSQSVVNKIYQLNKNFLGYQIFEAFMLLFIAVCQVKWIRKLTVNDSIV